MTKRSTSHEVTFQPIDPSDNYLKFKAVPTEVEMPTRKGTTTRRAAILPDTVYVAKSMVPEGAVVSVSLIITVTPKG